jgi:hypothetical protein
VGRSYSFIQILNSVVEFALYLLVRTENFARCGSWSHTFVARIDDIDVSEPFEWKVEPLEGAEVIEDMTVLVKRLQAPDPESATEFELGHGGNPRHCIGAANRQYESMERTSDLSYQSVHNNP